MNIFDGIEKYSHDIAMKIGKDESEDDIELYEYSIFMILSYLFTTLSGLAIAIIFRYAIYYIISHIAFISLRSKAGGYHCDTFKDCFITTNVINISMCALASLSYNVPLAMIVLSFGVGMIMAPNFPKPSVNSPSRGEEEDKRFRKQFIRNLKIISAISFLFAILKLNFISTSISAGILAVCFLSSDIGEHILNSFWEHIKA